MSSRYDVLIVGAGPAGASAAILLAQAGWSVALVEKQTFPRRKVCGECIAATNLGLLDTLGIGAAFHEIAGAPLRKVAFMLGKHTVLGDLPPLQAGPHPWGKALGREHLDTMLVARAMQLGVTVFQPWSIRSITGGPGDYSCEALDTVASQQRQLQAAVVIAAHGSWELAPDTNTGARQAKQPAKPGDLFAFKANFRGADLEAGMISVLGFEGGYGGMVLGDRGSMTLACCVRRDKLASLRHAQAASSAFQVVQSLLVASCNGARRALEPATQEGAWLSTGPIRPGIRLRRSSKFFLIGNAAGEAHPIVGEGMSMAMQSAWLLSRMLIAQPCLRTDPTAYRAVQQAYGRRWHACFAQRIRLAAVFAHASMYPRALSVALPVLQQWPALLTAAARYSGKSRPLYPPMPVLHPSLNP